MNRGQKKLLQKNVCVVLERLLVDEWRQMSDCLLDTPNPFAYGVVISIDVVSQIWLFKGYFKMKSSTCNLVQ